MLKRMIAALLTLMLTAILLPKAALAAVHRETNPAGTEISMEDTGDTLTDNYGTVKINSGTVTNNRSGGVIKNNASDGTVANNRGTIDINNGTVAGSVGTVTSNSGIVTANDGTVTTNGALGVIEANNEGATVYDNYGTVYNKGNFLVPNSNQRVGTVTNNYGTVYNNRGHVEYNGGEFGAGPGVVYNDHGSVENNVIGAVHNYYGVLSNSLGSSTEIHNYGSMNIYPSAGAYTLYQYWNVTINGSAAARVTASGLTNAFDKQWVLESSAVTLAPDDGYYFSSPPSATDGDVVADGETYKITNIGSDTEITVSGVSESTPVTFTSLAANGSDTETTSLLTLNFDLDIAGLTADDFTVAGATKGVLTKGNDTGIYSLAVSDITVADGGLVNVAVRKNGFAFSPADRDVVVRSHTPLPATYTVALNFKKDNAVYTGRSVSIENQSGGSTYALAESPGGSGIYTHTAVPNGTYTIRMDGVSTGKAVTVNGASGSATLEYFTVSFNANGGTPAPQAQVVIKGGKAAAPTVSKALFTLDGWYSDPALTTSWVFDTNTVTGTTTLYAKWSGSGIAPGFTTHPAAQTVTEGNSATFTVAVTGDPAPNLQWQVSTDSGATWNHVSDGTGGTSANYTTPAATTSMNGYRYRCVAQNSVTNATSNAAVLTVQAAPIVYPTVQVTPAAAFSQGGAPEIMVTVGEELSAFDLGNLSSVQMGPQGGGLTALEKGTHYDDDAGSIIITLYASYLNTLAPGVYTLQINLAGTGYPPSVRATITVLAPGGASGDASIDVPQTGDRTPIALFIGSALLAGALLAIRRTQWKEELDTNG